jgi:hypothetical protein
VNLGISRSDAPNNVPHRQLSRSTETRKPMQLRGPRPVRQTIAEPEAVPSYIARRPMFCPENRQEVPDGEVPRVTET